MRISLDKDRERQPGAEGVDPGGGGAGAHFPHSCYIAMHIVKFVVRQRIIPHLICH